MLTEERRQAILRMLGERGRVTALDLSAAFSVSEDTIRRDLRELAAAGLLRKVHGGALPASQGTATYAVRQTQSQQAKAAIAEEAVKLVQPGQVVVIDCGTTTLEVAKRMPSDLDLTVVTNSLPIAMELATRPGLKVLMVGGRVTESSLGTQGVATVDAFRSIRADLCFLGVCSLDAASGVTVPDVEEAHVKRAMVEEAARVITLASAEKIGTTSAFFVAPIEGIDVLITDAEEGLLALELMRARGLEVQVVKEA